MPVKISDTIAEEAIATLRALSCKETAAGETDLRRERAATSLLRLYQTQERYGLNPQAPADYARGPPGVPTPEPSNSRPRRRTTCTRCRRSWRATTPANGTNPRGFGRNQAVSRVRVCLCA
jgi:hypothetical protein